MSLKARFLAKMLDLRVKGVTEKEEKRKKKWKIWRGCKGWILGFKAQF